MAKPVVTYHLLEEFGACADELKAFQKVFPFGAEISRSSLTRAVVNDLKVAWLFENEGLIDALRLDKITIRKGFVTLKNGLLHSFKKRPSLVTAEEAPFVNLMWHKHGRRIAYATIDLSQISLSQNAFSFFGRVHLSHKRKRRGLETAQEFAEVSLIIAARHLITDKKL